MRVGWTADGTAAYLYNEAGSVVAKWFAGRGPSDPVYRNQPYFEPSSYAGGATSPQTAFGGARGQGSLWDVGATGGTTPGTGGVAQSGYGGNQGGSLYPEALTDPYVTLTGMGWTHADAQATLEQQRIEFDQTHAYNLERLTQEAAIAREQIAATSGDQRVQWAEQLRRLEIELASEERVAGLDRAQRAHEADQQFAVRIREIEGQERIQAATTWAKPIDYLAYNKWMSGQPAATTESGLPVGAPEFQTGQPAQAVGAGGVPAGDVYGAQLAAGGRIAEFGAWGGPTTPVGGTPWVAPAQANLTQFSNQPLQAQEMAYARWRQRGIMPETAQQVMRAAAPTGTAGRAVGYG